MLKPAGTAVNLPPLVNDADLSEDRGLAHSESSPRLASIRPPTARRDPVCRNRGPPLAPAGCRQLHCDAHAQPSRGVGVGGGGRLGAEAGSSTRSKGWGWRVGAHAPERAPGGAGRDSARTHFGRWGARAPFRFRRAVRQPVDVR